MTSPAAVCSCGIVHLDACPGPLRVCFSPGYVFETTIRLTDRRTGRDRDWPEGTTTRMRISWGTGTEMIVAGEVNGALLLFDLSPDETELVPRGALVIIDLNYDSGDPDRWRPWRAGRSTVCRR